MVRDRLHELHSASKHPPATEEEEMKPLKNKVNEAEEFFSNLDEVSTKVDKVKANSEELRTLWRQILVATHRDDKKEQKFNTT